MTDKTDVFLPPAWLKSAHETWLDGNRKQAIEQTVQWLKTLDKPDRSHEQLQLAYYYYFVNDFKNASDILKQIIACQPNNRQALVNLAVCYSRLNQFADAVTFAKKANGVSEDYLAYDVMANAYKQLGEKKLSSEAGTNALRIKDQNVSRLHTKNTLLAQWQFPAVTPAEYSRQPGKIDVISFSMWGDNPRYMRGAIQNILYGRQFFPGWQLRFYVDDSVPQGLQDLMEKMGACLIKMPSGQGIRERLTWRFMVSEDPFVGRFLVRDIDSVFSQREKNAVDAWLASDRWFHVIRDWWTHSDLILAGLWGGVAGVLPAMSRLLADYKSTAVETPNIDQWFLRDCVWPYIRQSCLAHDRCFTFNSEPLPDGPGTDSAHVGQNEFAVNEAAQAELLVSWINEIKGYDWQQAAPALGFHRT